MISGKKVHLFLASLQSYQDPPVRPIQSPADAFSPVVGINRFLRTYPDTRKRDDRGVQSIPCTLATVSWERGSPRRERTRGLQALFKNDHGIHTQPASGF